MKYKYFEDRKRDAFLSRLADIFNIKASIVPIFLNFDQEVSVRINTLKGKDFEDIKKELEKLTTLEPIPWFPQAFNLPSGRNYLSKSKLFKEGLIYLQNASSLIPVLALDPQPGDYILDICASPGGKASFIAQLTDNKAHLYVNDSVPQRVTKLKSVLDLLSAKAESITQISGEEIDKKLDQRFAPIESGFDKILLDAQCSGEGMINLSKPRALKYWSLSRIKKFQTLQINMIFAAYNLLKSGGTLVYSTCTFAPEENEIIINYLLRKYKDIRIEPINIELQNKMPGLTSWQGSKLNPKLKDALRVLPLKNMEGFFVCKLVKD